MLTCKFQSLGPDFFREPVKESVRDPSVGHGVKGKEEEEEERRDERDVRDSGQITMVCRNSRKEATEPRTDGYDSSVRRIVLEKDFCQGQGRDSS